WSSDDQSRLKVGAPVVAGRSSSEAYPLARGKQAWANPLEEQAKAFGSPIRSSARLVTRPRCATLSHETYATTRKHT
ncbi:MAG TPA: hypothetical protein VKY92_22585, partial [Verrucomicrobiae bacterium]|nr:hypothetical protein [Verrucomicrobiae bacterium]